MTAQIPERLRYQGEDHALCSEPLGSYFQMAGVKPVLLLHCTALWRGYIGSWEIVADRLYLVRLEAEPPYEKTLTVSTFFPDHPERVFAHWFSGLLRLPQGDLLRYRHMGWGSTYERDLFLKVDRGIVVGSWTRVNGQATAEALPGSGPGPGPGPAAGSEVPQ